jgi:hypothetical protein
MRFVIGHRYAESKEAPTYYCVDGLGRLSRVGDPGKATSWPSEAEAHVAIAQLGLSGDPTVFVCQGPE